MKQLRTLGLLVVALAGLLGRDLNADLPPDRRLPPGRSLSREEAISLAPELDIPALAGGVLFHDGQMYSSERLLLSVLLGASRAGAVISNHTEVVAPLRSGTALIGAVAIDRIAGERVEIRARVIVNATGAGAGSIAMMRASAAGRKKTGC